MLFYNFMNTTMMIWYMMNCSSTLCYPQCVVRDVLGSNCCVRQLAPVFMWHNI